MSEVEVRDARQQHRYEAVVDGAVAGFSQYRLSEGVITFVHTVVDDAYEGQGIGSRLVRGALDDVRRSSHLKVVAECPFVKAYIDRHAEYADLLAGSGFGAD
ncbi:MAG: GNAT family N-acetyltransferase [Actinomycetes bacterium]